MTGRPALAFDLGGTKILAALVGGAEVRDRQTIATDRAAGPGGWLDQMAQLAHNWSGRFADVGIAVTGLVRGGDWSALNPGTLNLPDSFPLAQEARRVFGCQVALANDAHAAAWGEYRYGAGAGLSDMVFLTVSTGIGGGFVAGGRLVTGRSGMAGSVGQLIAQPDDDDAGRFEDGASGTWIAHSAGLPDARAAFAVPEGEDAIALSALRLSRLCRNLQFLTDPEAIVVGGGIGLAPGYLDRVTAHLADLPDVLRPVLRPAALGADAGAIGIAALTQETTSQQREEIP